MTLAVLLPLLAILLMVCPGCGALGEGIVDEFGFEGKQRRYVLYLPEDYDAATAEPRPLVLVLHGKDQQVTDIRALTEFDDIADRENVLLAYPEAYQGAWNDGRIVPSQQSFVEDVDDVAFIQEVVARVHANYPVDRSRVYAAGFSNGGIMMHRLGIESAGLFAAVAAVAAAMPVHLADRLPNAPLSFLMVNGTGDAIVPWDGGELFPDTDEPQGAVLSVVDSAGFWAQNNACDKAAQTMLPNQETFDRTQVFEFFYSPCADEAEVVFYWVEGGGHAWPGAPRSQQVFTQGTTSGDLDASEQIWQFFRHQQRPQ